MVRSFAVLFWISAVIGSGGLNAGQNIPDLPPTGRVMDNALVFAGEEAGALKARLEKEFAEVGLIAGAELILKVESFATGTSAKALATAAAGEMLDPALPGAVMVVIRSDRAVALAVSKASSDIPDYVFSNVEKNPEEITDSGSGGEIEQFVFRSGMEMASVFRKYYGPQTDDEARRARADRVLMVSVAGGVFLLVLSFALLHHFRKPG